MQNKPSSDAAAAEGDASLVYPPPPQSALLQDGLPTHRGLGAGATEEGKRVTSLRRAPQTLGEGTHAALPAPSPQRPALRRARRPGTAASGRWAVVGPHATGPFH